MRLADGSAVVAPIALGGGMAAFSFYAHVPKTALLSCLLGWGMLAIAAIDARRFTIPDWLSLPAIIVGLVASGSMLDPSKGHLVNMEHVTGALLGGSSLWLVREGYFGLRGREGLGLGDVKLTAAAGAWTGWEHLPYVILLAAVAALAFALAWAIARRKGLSGTERIPLGTFLAPSIWVVWSLRELGGGAYY